MCVSHQDVEAGCFEQCDLIRDGQRGKAGQLFGELHRLDDALGGKFAEFIPQIHVQRDSVIRAVILRDEMREHITTSFFRHGAARDVTGHERPLLARLTHRGVFSQLTQRWKGVLVSFSHALDHPLRFRVHDVALGTLRLLLLLFLLVPVVPNRCDGGEERRSEQISNVFDTWRSSLNSFLQV